jgi:hypothetical protein
MAYWWEDDPFDDAKINGMSATDLYYGYQQVKDNADKQAAIKAVMLKKQEEFLEESATPSMYDLLSVVQVLDKEDLDKRAELKEKINKLTAGLEDKTDLISRLQRKAALEALKIIKEKFGEDTAPERTVIAGERNALFCNLEEAFVSNASQKEGADGEEWVLEDEAVQNFFAAERSGALTDHITDRNVAARLRDQIERIAGFENAKANDAALDDAVKELKEPYDQEGNLNELYADCAQLADSIQFEGVSDADAVRFKQVLLANAAQRAAQAILQQKYFTQLNANPQEVKEAFSKRIANEFEYGVIMAGLAGDEKFAQITGQIKKNSKTGAVEMDAEVGDEIAEAIENIKNGQTAIKPLAVELDSYILEDETKKVAKQLELKKIEPKQLSFWQKAKAMRKGLWHKLGEYVKNHKEILLANAAVVGGATLATVLGAGVGVAASVYAGWTMANAWLLPVYNKYKQNKEQMSNKAKWKAAWNSEYKDGKSSKMSKIHAFGRSLEGITAGVAAAFGGAIARSIAMVTGKAATLGATSLHLNKAKKELDKVRSIEQYKTVKKLELLKQQDKYALGGAVVGTVVGLVLPSMTSAIVNHLRGAAGNAGIPADSIAGGNGATPADGSEGVVASADSTNVADNPTAADAQTGNGAENGAEADTGAENGVEADTPAEPQVGDTLEEKDLGNGITKTVTKGSKYDYVQYTGVPKGDVQTPQGFQNFLEHRIHNMNQYNKLVEVVDNEGNPVALEDATKTMLDRLKDGSLKTPEGMTPEHALYIAYMRAHYYGDPSLLKNIACPDNVDIEALSRKLADHAADFNTHSNGVPYGYPTDGMKTWYHAGTVKTTVCKEAAAPVQEAQPEFKQPQTNAPKWPAQDIPTPLKIVPNAAKIMATTVYSNPNTGDYALDIDSIQDGSIALKSIDKNGDLIGYIQGNEQWSSAGGVPTDNREVRMSGDWHAFADKVNLNDPKACKMWKMYQTAQTYQALRNSARGGR